MSTQDQFAASALHLPSPGSMVGRSELAAAVVRRASEAVAVIHLDVDRFNLVNTRFGQDVGDRVLEVLARRVASRVPRSAMTAPMGPNGFIVALFEATGGDGMALAAELLRSVSDPVRIDGHEVLVRASAGVASRAEGDTGDLLEAAFGACRRAKQSRPGGVVSAAEVEGDPSSDGIGEADLAAALELGQLLLRYQPEVDLRTGEVVGLEALIRWQHPDLGELAPGRWLGLAERTGLIRPIGEWVVAEAIDRAAELARLGTRPVRIWVNLSADQLVDLSRIRQMVISQVQMGFDPRWLGFEVTESGLLRDVDRTVAQLAEMKAVGVDMALDDFGTGYSSLAYLRRLPVSAVKIDRSFVSGVGESLADTAIVDAVTDLAHALDLVVIAEGVEELAQLEALQEAGVDRAQGYWLARPALMADVPALLAPWCGRSVARAGRDQAPGPVAQRSQMLFSALDALGTPCLVTGVPTVASGRLPAIVSANSAVADAFGLSGDVTDTELESLLDLTKDPSAAARWRQALQATSASSVRVMCRQSGGPSRPWDVEIRPFEDARGHAVYRLQVFRPALGADALRLDELVVMLDSTTDGLGLFDHEGRLRWSNDNGLMGRASHSMLGRPMYEVAIEADQERARHWLTAVLRHEPVDPLLFRVNIEGTPRWFEFRAVPANDRIDGLLLVARDMDRHVRSEETRIRRERLDQLAFAVSRRALELPPAEFLASADELLREIAEWMQVDEAWIDGLDDDGPFALAIASPRSPEVLAEGFPKWAEFLEGYIGIRGEIVVINDLEQFDDPELQAFRPPDADGRGLIVVPLVSAGEVLGDFGVATLTEPRQWTEQDLNACRRIAETIANVIARSRSERAVLLGQQRLDAVLNASAELIGVVDAAGMVRFANERAAAYFGFPAAELEQLDLARFIHPDDFSGLIASFDDAIRHGEVRPTECRMLGADGEYRWFEVSNGVVLDPILNGAVLTAREITERREAAQREARRVAGLELGLTVAQRALDQSPQVFIEHLRGLLRLAGELLEVDTMYVDVVDDTGDELRVLVGWAAPHLPNDPTQIPPVSRADAPKWFRRLERLDPLLINDTRAVPRPEVNEGTEGDAALIVPMSAGGRLVGAIGASSWSGPRAWTDDDVTVLRLLGDTISNVMVRQRLDEALAGSEARFRLLSEASVDVIGLCDELGRITYASPSVTRVLGRSPDEVIGRTVLSLMRPGAAPQVEAVVAGLEHSGWESFEIELQHADGHFLWAGVTVSLVPGALDGRPLYRFSLRDISDIKRLQAELQRRALHDPLTGLANRVLLHSRLESVLASQSGPCSVMLIDLDGFKQVNDTLGHAVGDDVLRLMAARLSALAGRNDTLSRFGGDEFVMVCPGLDRTGAEAVAERIVDAMGREVPVSDTPVRLGASVGIAVGLDTDVSDAARLLIEADRAMYDAKRAGKGCVRATIVAGDGNGRADIGLPAGPQ